MASAVSMSDKQYWLWVEAARLDCICGEQSANRVGSPVARMSRWNRAHAGPGVALLGYAAASLSDYREELDNVCGKEL
jgi:hypothetical protein